MNECQKKKSLLFTPFRKIKKKKKSIKTWCTFRVFVRWQNKAVGCCHWPGRRTIREVSVPSVTSPWDDLHMFSQHKTEDRALFASWKFTERPETEIFCGENFWEMFLHNVGPLKTKTVCATREFDSLWWILSLFSTKKTNTNQKKKKKSCSMLSRYSTPLPPGRIARQAPEHKSSSSCVFNKLYELCRWMSSAIMSRRASGGADELLMTDVGKKKKCEANLCCSHLLTKLRYHGLFNMQKNAHWSSCQSEKFCMEMLESRTDRHSQ